MVTVPLALAAFAAAGSGVGSVMARSFNTPARMVPSGGSIDLSAGPSAGFTSFPAGFASTCLTAACVGLASTATLDGVAFAFAAGSLFARLQLLPAIIAQSTSSTKQLNSRKRLFTVSVLDVMINILRLFTILSRILKY